MRCPPPIIALALVLATPAHAENVPGREGVAIVQGECNRLITGADDYTSRCDSQAASATLADGTVMFIFSIEGMPIGFSGNGRQVGEAEVDGLMRLPVDFVALGENASDGAFPADGDCWFSDPYLGPAVIWCTALTRGGPFLAAFKTDGSAPEEQ